MLLETLEIDTYRLPLFKLHLLVPKIEICPQILFGQKFPKTANLLTAAAVRCSGAWLC